MIESCKSSIKQASGLIRQKVATLFYPGMQLSIKLLLYSLFQSLSCGHAIKREADVIRHVATAARKDDKAFSMGNRNYALRHKTIHW